LASKSLVLVDERTDETRYRMLATVREYGLEKLHMRGELDTRRRRHAEAYLALARQAKRFLRGPQHLYWADRLTREHDNIHAALSWCRDDEDSLSVGMRLAGALWQFWVWCGPVTEGHAWLEGMLARMPDDTEPSLQAQLLLGACSLAFSENERALHDGEQVERMDQAMQHFGSLGDQDGIALSLCLLGMHARADGDLARAQDIFENSLAIARQGSRLTWVVEWPLERLAHLAASQQEWTRAIGYCEEYLAVARKIGDDLGAAEALTGLGILAMRQLDFRRAMELSQQALQLARRARHRMMEIQSLMQIAEAARYQGDYGRARTVVEELRAGSWTIDDEYGAGFAMQLLGKIARDEGNCDQARDLFVQSLGYQEKLGGWSVPFNLEGLATVACMQGQVERATRLFGAAEAIRQAAANPLPTDNLAQYQQYLAALRTQLSPGEFDSAWAEGAAMTVEQAVEYARAG
jgi:non-specific serine/threonine protein kinase